MKIFNLYMRPLIGLFSVTFIVIKLYFILMPEVNSIFENSLPLSILISNFTILPLIIYKYIYKKSNWLLFSIFIGGCYGVGFFFFYSLFMSNGFDDHFYKVIKSIPIILISLLPLGSILGLVFWIIVFSKNRDLLKLMLKKQ